MAEGNVYETTKLLHEYLAFDYGGPSVNSLHPLPVEYHDFPKRTAELCIKHSSKAQGGRALDIGCAVGRASFELAAHFKEVQGMDFSHGFINACNKLKENGSMDYSMTTEGYLSTKHVAEISSNIDRQRCQFWQGDACDLPTDLGKFDCVLSSNLICRLPQPMTFLQRCADLVAPGGILVLVTPYSFSEDYTPKEHWIGGFVKDGKEVKAADTVKSVFDPHFDLVESFDMPWIIRETARKHQVTFGHATVWRRKSS